jgi:hypothetical protein
MFTVSLRTDPVSGILTTVFGSFFVFIGLMGLLIVGIQHLFIAYLPPGSPEQSVEKKMQAMHGVLVVHLPIVIVGGAVLAISGLLVRRGYLVARRIAQATALGGYVWGYFYFVDIYRIKSQFQQPSPSPIHSETTQAVFEWVSLIGGILILAGLPTGLLYILSRPRERKAAN